MQAFMATEFQGAVERIKKFSDNYNYFIKPNAQGAQLHQGGKA
jgi:hypothetical protein